MTQHAKLGFAVTLFALYASLFALTNCAALKKGAATVLDIAEALCIVAHAEISDEAALLACDVIKEHKDAAKTLLLETRKANAKAAKAGVCRSASDAGLDAGSDAALEAGKK